MKRRNIRSIYITIWPNVISDITIESLWALMIKIVH